MVTMSIFRPFASPFLVIASTVVGCAAPTPPFGANRASVREGSLPRDRAPATWRMLYRARVT